MASNKSIFGYILMSAMLLTSLLNAQSKPEVKSLQVFRDGAVVSLSGNIRFTAGEGSAVLPSEPLPGSVTATGAGSMKISYTASGPDSMSQPKAVTNWSEILRANLNREVAIAYLVGNEFDEISGRIVWLDDHELVQLRTTSGKDIFIPVSQIRQVIVEGAAQHALKGMVSTYTAVIGIEDDLPFAPVNLSYGSGEISWRPEYEIQSWGEKSMMNVYAVIENQAFDISAVEVTVLDRFLEAGVGTGSGIKSSFRLNSLKKGHTARVLILKKAVTFDLFVTADFAGVHAGTQPAEQYAFLRLSPEGCALTGREPVRIFRNEILWISAQASRPCQYHVSDHPASEVFYSEELVSRSDKPERRGDLKVWKEIRKGTITIRNFYDIPTHFLITREVHAEISDPGEFRVQETEGKSVITADILVEENQEKQITFQFETYKPAE